MGAPLFAGVALRRTRSKDPTLRQNGSLGYFSTDFLVPKTFHQRTRAQHIRRLDQKGKRIPKITKSGFLTETIDIQVKESFHFEPSQLPTVSTGEGTYKMDVAIHPLDKHAFIWKDFEARVSGIIEVDSEPPWRRKILLVRSSMEGEKGENKNSPPPPIGFYIREGFNVQVGSHCLDKVPGVFVSRILSGSLADTSGLISVGDQLLDINNVPVAGKSLDEVTNMLTWNGLGVHLTLKPSTGRLFDRGSERGSRRNRQSLSAPTTRKNAGLNQPRPQTPLLVTKRAQIRFESHELHEAQDLPPQTLLRLPDSLLCDH